MPEYQDYQVNMDGTLSSSTLKLRAEDLLMCLNPLELLKERVGEMFSGSNIKAVKKAPNGMNFYDYEATRINGKKIKLR